MSIHRIYAIVLRVYYLMRGSFTRIFPLFAWSVLDLILWGFITRYLSTIAAAAFNLTTTLLGAVLLWEFFTRSMFGVSTSFFEDVWSRNFLNLFSTPLTVPEYLTGLVLTSVATSFFGLGIMILLTAVVFHLSIAVFGLWAILFVLVLFIFGIALGIFAIGVVFRFGPSAEWFIWPMPAVLAPFAAVFYPVSSLPEPMQWVSRLIPASYVFEGLRSLLAGGGARLDLLLAGTGVAALYVMLACWFFYAMYRRAVRTGLIARYSAESVI